MTSVGCKASWFNAYDPRTGWGKDQIDAIRAAAATSRSPSAAPPAPNSPRPARRWTRSSPSTTPWSRPTASPTSTSTSRARPCPTPPPTPAAAPPSPSCSRRTRA
ncbi:hypothetical protein ACFQ1I_12315 [Kitasatospora arboriphila]